MPLSCVRRGCPTCTPKVNIRTNIWGWGGGMGDKSKGRAAFLPGGSSGLYKPHWEALCLIWNMKHRLAMAEEYLQFDGPSSALRD